MYYELIMQLRAIGFITPILWVCGTIGFCGAWVFFIVSYFQSFNSGRYWIAHLVLAITCTLIFFTSVAIGSSPLVDPKWVIAVEAAKELDKYNETHPDSHFSPTALIGTADDIVEGITETVLGIPELIKLVSSSGTPEARAEIFDRRELERLRRENDELRRKEQ
jgi:hypothetical protein